MKLADMSWDEAVGKCKGKIILVPHGSTEEHGYHLPIKTDSLIAEKVCEAFNASKRIAVAPVMNYTALYGTKTYRGTKNFPGSVGPALQENKYLEWVKTITNDFLKLSPKRLVFFLAHDGTRQRKAFDKAIEKFGRRLEYASASKIGREAAEKNILGSCGHAGEGETSLLLYLDPHSVKLDRAVNGGWSKKGVHKSGVGGNPLDATKQKGKKLFDFHVDYLKKMLK